MRCLIRRCRDRLHGLGEGEAQCDLFYRVFRFPVVLGNRDRAVAGIWVATAALTTAALATATLHHSAALATATLTTAALTTAGVRWRPPAQAGRAEHQLAR